MAAMATKIRTRLLGEMITGASTSMTTGTTTTTTTGSKGEADR